MPGSYPFQAQRFFFNALANPFATNWVPLQENLLRGQPAEYESAITPVKHWFNLVVNPVGEVYFDPDTEEVPDLSEVLSSDELVSMFKLEIEYSLGQSRIVRRRLDIGTGLDVFVTASHLVKARILVPDPSSVPDLLPSSVQPRRNLRVAAAVDVGTQCEDNRFAGREAATYTQPFFLVAGTPQATARLEVQNSAKEAQATADSPFSGTIEFIHDRQGFDETVVGEFFTSSAPLDNTSSAIVPIPQLADIIRIDPAAAGAGQVVTIIQRLKF